MLNEEKSGNPGCDPFFPAVSFFLSFSSATVKKIQHGLKIDFESQMLLVITLRIIICARNSWCLPCFGGRHASAGLPDGMFSNQKSQFG
jgi:hypothetical protein